MAFDTQHSVQDATDFVVMGSDGLFDNMYDVDIDKCLTIAVIEKDKKILYELKKFFGCGNVYFQKDKHRIQYIVKKEYM